MKKRDTQANPPAKSSWNTNGKWELLPIRPVDENDRQRQHARRTVQKDATLRQGEEEKYVCSSKDRYKPSEEFAGIMQARWSPEPANLSDWQPD